MNHSIKRIPNESRERRRVVWRHFDLITTPGLSGSAGFAECLATSVFLSAAGYKYLSDSPSCPRKSEPESV